MAVDEKKMGALIITGGFAVLAVAAFTFASSQIFFLLSLAYVVATSAALALRRSRTRPVLAVAWLVAYGVAAVALTIGSGSTGFGVMMGAVFASVFIVAWMALAFFLLLAIDPARRRVVP
ncbi:hypothetical protein ASE01_20690 [Nocardioides sp. Root190]|uniref:hypothetical protein n=1 Tax=Nocardioides sp. Root190 TaxID=1736488 RepID=UPI0006FF46E1|nr:hypothetical protein [Nocardioides sp. Root190]KRB73181.1 hypothetical protein ASE01_20690 [Nocardioides sp. Root190]